MARLGEQLASAGLVSTDKIEQALRAQVVWGGRLGTNLVELGLIELDELSRALGQQHGTSAALSRHFDAADAALQAKLPPELARRFSVVPLVRLTPERIALVAIDPLSDEARQELSFVYGIDPEAGIVASVAPEMRVLYHLERVYKIARAARYLRTKKAGATMEFPAFDNVPVEVDSDSDIAIPITIDEAVHPTGRVQVEGKPGEDLTWLLDSAIQISPAPIVEDESQGKARRHVLRTLGDAVAPVDVDDATMPVSTTAPSPGTPSATSPPKGALGRIAIRRVAVPAGGGTPVDTTSAPETFVEATRAIKRGMHRDRVADLVIETLERFVPTCGAAMLLVLRGDVAIGWKHFSRAEDGTPEVAVPLDQGGTVPTAISGKAPMRCTSDDLSALDALLLRAVGNGEDNDLAVVPITIADQVMCLLAAATSPTADLAPLEAVASAAATAFARLIRDASR